MRDTDLVITTEKDLVKLERFPFPRDSLYALRLEVTMDAVDARALDELIPARVAAAATAADA
jgi:tetraacyldisaccharide-1-P 4'-kinase